MASAGLTTAFPSSAAAQRWLAGTRLRGGDYALALGLLLGDMAALAAAFLLGYLIRFKTDILPFEESPDAVAFYWTVSLWAVPLWIVLFAAYRLYDSRQLFAGIQEYVRIVNACTVGVVGVVLICFLHVEPVIARGWVLATWFLAIVLVNIGRFAARRVVRRLRSGGLLVSPTIIVGANEEGIALAEQLQADAGSRAQLIGFLDSALPTGTPVCGNLTVLGDFWKLDDLIRRLGLREVIVATTAVSRDELLDMYWNYGHNPSLELHLSSGLFELVTTGVQVGEISGVPLVTPHRLRITGTEAVLKTVLDYLIAATVLVALAPALLAIALLIKLDSPGPVLHRRHVLGVAGRRFNAFKFRTMVTDADAMLGSDPVLRDAFEQGYKLKRDPRVTRVGAFLRRTSLDEVPQLLNVLLGQMSLVGPRMISPEEAARYGKWQRNLVTVKPGITGPWQVRGRGDLPYEQRIKLSMQYIRNYTLWEDLAILIRTVFVVLKGRGAY